MKLEIGSDIPEFQELMRKRARAAPVVIKKAVIDATSQIFTLSVEEMDRLIYNSPIPTKVQKKRKIRSGKRKGKFRQFKAFKDVPAWRRTSTLIRNERYYFRGKGADVTGIIDNKTPYAQARHNLNRPSPVDGKTRLARWRDSARQRGTPIAREIFREAINIVINHP